MQGMTVTPPHGDCALVHGVTALVASLAAVAIVRRVGSRRGWVARPREDRWHNTPVALHGGLGVVAAIAAAFVLFLNQPSGIEPSLVGAFGPPMLLLMVVGLVDDLKHIGAIGKLVWQLVAVALLGWLLTKQMGMAPTDAAIVAAWALVFTNSVNMLDNMDGACATAAVPCFIAIALITVDTRVASLAGAAAGAMAGFWMWNRPRAGIFLGDSGSLPVGALLGGLAAMISIEHASRTAFESSTAASAGLAASALASSGRAWMIAVLPLVLCLPFSIDTGFVCLTRLARGQNPMIGGTDHLTHRALRSGRSIWSVLAVIAALGVVGGLAAWTLSRIG